MDRVDRRKEEMSDDTMRFNGVDYQPPRDNPRLTRQYTRVFNYMKDGRWRTLRAIAETTNDPEASVSAQLRHMRKPRFGGHTVNKEYVSGGLYSYQLVVRQRGDPVVRPEPKVHCPTCTCNQSTEQQRRRYD